MYRQSNVPMYCRNKVPFLFCIWVPMCTIEVNVVYCREICFSLTKGLLQRNMFLSDEGPTAEKHVSLWRRAYARNVRLYYPYWQYINLFIFRFVQLKYGNIFYLLNVSVYLSLSSEISFVLSLVSSSSWRRESSRWDVNVT